MGKRETVKKPRLARDFYGTVDPAAAEALKPHLYSPTGRLTRYVEPCAGDGSLIRLLASTDCPVECAGAYDIDPQGDNILQRNALYIRKNELYEVDCFITNPPFRWDMLQPLLDYLPTLKPTWLLLPADSMHNKRTSHYMGFCSDIVSVGRLYWFADDKGKNVKGVDNYCFYKFDAKHKGFTKFHPRVT